MISLEEARQCILQQVRSLPEERVPLLAAHRRYSARPLHSPVCLPPFDNSSVDGYALRAGDAATAGPDRPVSLKCLDQLPAGNLAGTAVTQASCVRLFTGSPLPPGADAVVMQEATRPDPDASGFVQILEPVAPGENIRLAGEGVRKDALLVERGARFHPATLALCAAAGFDALSVGQRPRVGILATGAELQEPGGALEPGHIFESNRFALAAMIANLGGEPIVYPLVPDELAATQTALQKAFAECDAVVSSGGVSVGDLDYVRTALEAVGGKIHFWRIQMKPGKPFVFGMARDRPFFGLPGNPVSALLTFFLLVRPALLQMQGAKDLAPPRHTGVLAEPLANPGSRRHFLRVAVDRDGQVRSAGLQASHALLSLARANGLVDLPPNTTLSKGASVSVIQWGAP